MGVKLSVDDHRTGFTNEVALFFWQEPKLTIDNGCCFLHDGKSMNHLKRHFFRPDAKILMGPLRLRSVIFISRNLYFA